MSYLLDKSRKRKKFLKIAFCLVLFVFLFYFRSGIFSKLSYVGHAVFRPVLILGNAIGGKLGNASSFFASKNSLYNENIFLKSQLEADRADRANYNSVLAENINLKETLGRKNEKAVMTLAAILSKPNQSPYDTLVIDAGANQAVKESYMVFALGNIPIGRISAVYANSSKVILFSNGGEKTQVVISAGRNPASEAGLPASPEVTRSRDIFMELVGRGGGNFEMILPRDFNLLKGDQAVLPGIVPYVVGVVETIISDPRDSFKKALLVSPVNIQEIKFVEVEVSAK